MCFEHKLQYICIRHCLLKTNWPGTLTCTADSPRFQIQQPYHNTRWHAENRVSEKTSVLSVLREKYPPKSWSPINTQILKAHARSVWVYVSTASSNHTLWFCSSIECQSLSAVLMKQGGQLRSTNRAGKGRILRTPTWCYCVEMLHRALPAGWSWDGVRTRCSSTGDGVLITTSRQEEKKWVKQKFQASRMWASLRTLMNI